MTGRKATVGGPQSRRPVRKSNPRSKKVVMKSPVQLSTLMVIAVLVLGVGALGWRFVSPSLTTATVKVKVPELSAVALRGQQAFDANCATCHGPNGAGSDKGPPLVHTIYNPGHHDDGAFFRAANQGVPRHHWNFGDMPPLPEVTDGQIADIVRYMRELQQANDIFYQPHQM